MTPTPKQRPGIAWKRQPTIEGVTGNYSPFVVSAGGLLEIWANTDGATIGTWFRREGTLAAVGPANAVLEPDEITDQEGEALIRTTAVARSAAGHYYAILHVGHGYPSQTGYVPAFARSDDGIAWNYAGKLEIDGAIPYAYASGANLIVQEEKPADSEPKTPAQSRFLLWNDAYTIDGEPKKLVLIHSADGRRWHFHRDAEGTVADVWPEELAGDRPVFPAACKTPFGYHLICGDRYPVEAHRHLFSEDGTSWRILERQSATYAGYKGTNLAYDQTTGLIHAITAARHHLTLEAKAF